MNRLSLFFVLGLALIAHAQDDVAPPKAPFTLLPAKAAWDIDVSDVKDSPGTPPTAAKPPIVRQLTRIESVKSGDTKRDILNYSDGSKEEIWYRGNYRLVSSPDHKFAMVLAPPTDAALGLSATLGTCSGFPGVDWMTASDYQKPVPQNSTLCYFFERKDKDAVAGQAWIDVHTGLPVQVQIGDVKYVFKFKPEPDGELTLPSPYAEAWKRFETLEARRRLIAAPAHQ